MQKLSFKIFKIFTVVLIALVLVIVFLNFYKPVQAATGINRFINFQGKLANNPNGTNVSNTNYTIVFTIYDNSAGGTALWTETQTVTTADGIFRVALGSVNPIPSNFNFNWSNLYLGIKVNSDSEMTPRVQLTSVPFAFNSQTVAGLTVQDTSGNASTSGILQIANGKTINLGTQNLTFSTSADTTLTLPTTGTLLTNTSAASQTITSTQTSGNVLSIADTSGTSTLAGISFNLNGSGTTYDLLGTGSSWSITKAGALTVASCTGCGVGGGGVNWWNQLGGALSPVNNANDLLLGSTATSTAAFSFTGLNLSNHQTQASFSGNFIVMPNNGYGGNVGIGTSLPSYDLDLADSFHMFNSISPTLKNLTVDLTKEYQTDNTPNVVLQTYAPSIYFKDTTPSSTSFTEFVDGNTFMIRKETGTYSNTDALFSIGSTGLVTLANNLSLAGSSPTISATGTNTLTLNNGSTGAIQFFGPSYGITSGGALTVASCSGCGTGGGGVNYFGQNQGLTFVGNTTSDFAIGGNSTSSADFVFGGINNPANGGIAIATFSGALMMNSQPDSSVFDLSNWQQISGTLGTIGGNTTTQIASISAMAAYNGSIYVGTYKNPAGSAGSAEVYRYNGSNSSWTLVSQSGGAGQIAAGGTSGIASISAMTVFNGALYIGTSKMNSAEVYRYEGGTTWTKISGPAAGTLGSVTAQDGISSLGVYQGQLYAGTREPGGARLMSYGGGITWTAVNTTAGTFVATNTVGVHSVGPMVVKNGFLYFAAQKTGDTDLLRYAGGQGATNAFFLNMNLASITGSYIINGTATTGVDEITAMTVYNGAVILAIRRGNNQADILQLNDGMADGTTPPNSFTRLNNAIGQMCNTCTTGVDSINALTVYNGYLYAGTNEAGKAEIYRYVGGDQKWTLVSQSGGTGQIANGGQTGIYAVSALQPLNADLYAATFFGYSGGAEVYKLSNVNINKSYSLIFHASPDMGGGEQNGNANMASIYYLASASANLGNSSANSGAFIFDHGIQTRNGSYDVAEDYPTRDDTLTPGDVVSIDPNETGFVTKSTTINDYRVIGVFSSKPALRLSQQDAFINGGYVVPIALAGRVPVKVSTQGGEIKAGDYLTPSSTPGVAMKATRSGGVIGQAMEGYSGDGVGKILIYVKSMTYQGSLADNFANFDTKAPDFAVNVLSQLNTSPFDGTSSITTDRLIAGLQLITPEVDATKINISEINPLSSGNIALNLTDEGKFIINGSNSSITFDSEGNAVFPGLLIADKIKANQIIGLDIFTNRLSSLDESIATLSSQFSSGSAVLGASAINSELSLSSLNVEGLATVSGDLNVKGNSIFEKALTVLDSIATQNLIVSNFATFFNDVVFKGNTRFTKVPTFNSDAGGFAVIGKGERSVQVSFDNEYVNTPVVTASIVLDKLSSDGAQQQLESDILNGSITFVVTQRTTKGFVIKLNKEAPDDINFSWISISIYNAKTFGVSQGPSPSPSLSPLPTSTPSAAVQSILNQLSGQGPGNGGE